IALGATLGFFGISTGLFIQVLLTSNLKSFGVPYLVPTGPRTSAGADVVTRLPVFFHESRPDYVNPQDVTRAPRVSRTWLKKDGGDQR
ncbi:MAG TPA: spore germination protein, partial [Bacillota bacterium]|nr:spore germination protein [Bacillota bacterium]